jgi:NADH-quinone oxidoreductase subunit A
MGQYIGVILAFGFGAVTFALFMFLYRYLPPGPSKIKEHQKNEYDRAKEATYECGVDPTGDARSRFTVKFFLMAMLFVIFDIEAVLIFPWAATFKLLGVVGFVEMMIFIVVLVVGLAYVWKKGALEW